MADRKRVTSEALKAAYDLIPDEVRANGVRTSLALAGAVIRAFFGEEWFDQYVIPGRRQNFLTFNETNSNLSDLSAYRLMDLAESLYNLQNIDGFDECIERMRNGDIEGTHAELDFGRMLYMHKVPFAYVVPTGVTGSDYDVDILYPNGLAACADAKCKIETTPFREKTIRYTLDKARSQLPDDKPGIVFVKFPPHWLDEADFVSRTVEVAEDFLRTTRRIISVKYYVAKVVFGDGMMRVSHGYKEISNRVTDFGSGRNWDIFRRINFKAQWNGTPPWWQRIIYYPDGKPR